MKYSFSLLFWIKKARIDKNGEVSIYARVTVNGKRAEIATGEKVHPDRWNVSTGSVKGNREDVRRINSTLDRIRLKIRGIYHNLLEKEEPITSALIKNIYLGKKDKEYTILEVFRQHNEQMRVQVGKE